MNRRIIYVDNFLAGHGHTPTTGTTLVKLLRQEGYSVIPTSKQHNKVVRLLQMLFTIYQNRNNSVVLIATYSTSAFYFACACGYICRFFNIPYIPCLHGGNLPARIKRSALQSKKYFSGGDVNVAVSGYLQQSMIENGWKCNVIPNSIHIQSYPYNRKTACSPSMLWVRSFHSIYNPLLAIRITAALVKKYPDIKLTMVGPDKDGSLTKCRKLVEELHLEQHITFTGLLTLDEWVKLAASHDIFLNTTNFDNLPVSVIEAMALGLIIVSSNVGGIPYLITDKENGLLVPAGNEDAFIAAIEKVIDHKQLAEKLSAVARAKAEEFDWGNIKFLWNRLFNNIKGKAPIVNFYQYVVRRHQEKNTSLWN